VDKDRQAVKNKEKKRYRSAGAGNQKRPFSNSKSIIYNIIDAIDVKSNFQAAQLAVSLQQLAFTPYLVSICQ
jgi:hypothetical protein